MLGDGHGSGFTVVVVVRASDEPRPQHYRWLVVPTVRTELEDLMESNVRHPDVVLAVHRDHVGQEENIPTPGVDDVTRGVDCNHCVHGYWCILVQAKGVVPSESLSIPSPVSSVEDDSVAIDINGHSRYLPQPDHCVHGDWCILVQ